MFFKGLVCRRGTKSEDEMLKKVASASGSRGAMSQLEADNRVKPFLHMCPTNIEIYRDI